MSQRVRRDEEGGREVEFDADIGAQLRAEVGGLFDEWKPGPEGRHLRVSRLAGGFSSININLKVTGPATSYVLRFCLPGGGRWGIARAAAIQAQRDAADLGLAPRIVGCSLPAGHFLAEFADGETLTPELLRTHELIPLVASTLRVLHAGRTSAREFSPFDDLRTFLEVGAAEGAVPPRGFEDVLARCFRIEALFRNRDVPRAFCHSDLVPQNLILQGQAFKLVDFDYAGTGWIAFELASFACHARLDGDETEILLTSYDPRCDGSQRARVELMRFVAGVREATWAMMAEPILGQATLPIDGWTYKGYAEEHLRQADIAVEAGFDAYLAQARVVAASATF